MIAANHSPERSRDMRFEVRFSYSFKRWYVWDNVKLKASGARFNTKEDAQAYADERSRHSDS
jgi:hypothetical protein